MQHLEDIKLHRKAADVGGEGAGLAAGPGPGAAASSLVDAEEDEARVLMEQQVVASLAQRRRRPADVARELREAEAGEGGGGQ